MIKTFKNIKKKNVYTFVLNEKWQKTEGHTYKSICTSTSGGP